MIEKKLIEKEVEVKKVEKRVVEVYHYEGKDYYDNDELRRAIGNKMSETFNSFLRYATDSCHLVSDTKVDILKRNLNWCRWGNQYGKKVFISDRFDEMIDRLKELKSIYSQVED